MKFWLLFFIIPIGVELSAQSNFPTSRFVDWKIAGMQSWDESLHQLIQMQDYNIDSQGQLSNSAVLDSILTANQGHKIRIHFPAGTYLFNSTIHLGSEVIIEGEGADLTHFVFQLGGTGNAIESTGQELNTVTANFQQSAIKNDHFIVLNPNHGFEIGDWIRVVQSDTDLVYSSWAVGSVGQLVQIDDVHGDTVLLHSPLRTNYPMSRFPRVNKVIPNSHVVIRCISLERMDDTAPEQASSIAFTNVVHSYVDGIASRKCTFAHVELTTCSNVNIRKSYFKDAFDYGDGGRAYGVVMHFTTNECRVEDNIFDHLRHSILLQAGANGNVSSFNFAVNPYWTNSNPLLTSTSAGELVLHGNYVYSNLFEQNKVDNIVIDNSHGANGPDNLFYRNMTTLYGIFFSDATSPNQLIIGNEITNTAFPYSLVNYTISGSGHFLFGNNNKGTISPAGTGVLMDTSFAYVSCPDFVPGTMWMQIGSGVSLGNAQIPAAYRYSMNNYFANACGNSDTGQIEFKKIKINLYPNPTNGNVEVSCDFNLYDEIQLFDNQGRALRKDCINSTKMQLNLDGLSPGIYHLHFEGAKLSFPIVLY